MNPNKKRQTIQWMLLPLFFIVIVFGWKYPILGFAVPIVMFAGIATSFFNGRYICGNWCPRGAFLDRILSKCSPQKKIPDLMHNMLFRRVISVLLIGFIIFYILLNPTSWQHWGFTFWLLCIATTAIALLLGFFTHQRAWCTICPIGTLSNTIGGKKRPLKFNEDACVGCKKCEKVCPLQLKIISKNKNGFIDNPDCSKCLECVHACPKNALSE